MSRYRLSTLAELDLADIADYTIDVWGAQQAEVYLNSLTECFLRIAKMPGLGRTSDSVHSGLCRIEEGKHVIFYTADRAWGLHQQNSSSKHAPIEAQTWLE